MRTDSVIKTFGIGFVLALVLYIAGFSWIQHKREYKGPWIVTFASDEAGTPYLLVTQKHLQIEPHKIVFADQHIERTNLLRTVRFEGPTTNAAFGEIVFQDPTFLPGTVTFNFWSHEIELMPRTLVINKEEIPWHSKTNITLTGEGKFERKPVKKRTTKPLLI